MVHPFISFAQNGEDVVLHRALHDVDAGTYIDVGANHPTIDSVTRAFYDRGWRGILAEPNPHYAALLREHRPGDWVAEAAVSNGEGSITLHSIEGTGLSTIVDRIGSDHSEHGFTVIDIEVPQIGLSRLIDEADLGDRPIHFLSVDTEGAELAVLSSLDFSRHRPWILVIEATAPNSTTQVHAHWEHVVVQAGYQFCLFDGLSRYYVANEHSDRAQLLSYPACTLDNWVRVAELEAIEGATHARSIADELQHQLNTTDVELKQTERELADIRMSTSWRVTAPLRRLTDWARSTRIGRSQ